MEEGRLLGALSNFSFFFAPFLFPLIVWFFTSKESFNHEEAKRALKIHILPVVITVIAFILIGGVGFFTNDSTVTGYSSVILIGLTLVIDGIAVIYSIYRGIKVLSN